MNMVFLLLGSNLNDREVLLKMAREAINLHIGQVTGESSIYETEPWGFQSGTNFLNQAITIRTSLEPTVVLEKILDIEKAMGRVRSGNGYGSRSIDIDILFFGDQVISRHDLQIPHPHLQERMFTLVPLCELDAGYVHPTLMKSVKELAAACPDNKKVFLYGRAGKKLHQGDEV
jgi:2-amino-4-hydroxy-6-hydroxymethyldihydropteridine diphosphokinase